VRNLGEMDRKLVVSLILSGHPQLKDRLFESRLTDVRQRMSHCITLRPLSRAESHEYIKHRFALVGRSEVPIEGSALSLVYEMSRGNMRAIDNIMLRGLQIAAQKKHETIATQDITEAGEKLWT
jgi:general secretion pathway protein A